MQEETSETHGDFIQPFTAASAATLLQDGFVQQEGDESVYYAPDAALLLSEAFAMAYCFRAVLPRQRRSEPPSPLIGIAFEPARVVKPAIEGTIWLDRTTGYVSSLEFRYRGIPVPNEAEGQAGGRLSFSRASHGVIIIDEWSIRMPIIGITLASSGRQQEAVRAFMEVGASISALEIHRYRHRTVVRLDHRRTAGWGIDRNRRRDSARPFRLERAVRPAHRTVWQLRFADSPPPYRRARHHAARARGHGADA